MLLVAEVEGEGGLATAVGSFGVWGGRTEWQPELKTV